MFIKRFVVNESANLRHTSIWILILFHFLTLFRTRILQLLSVMFETRLLTGSLLFFLHCASTAVFDCPQINFIAMTSLCSSETWNVPDTNVRNSLYSFSEFSSRSKFSQRKAIARCLKSKFSYFKDWQDVLLLATVLAKLRFLSIKVLIVLDALSSTSSLVGDPSLSALCNLQHKTFEQEMI